MKATFEVYIPDGYELEDIDPDVFFNMTHLTLHVTIALRKIDHERGKVIMFVPRQERGTEPV